MCDIGKLIDELIPLIPRASNHESYCRHNQTISEELRAFKARRELFDVLKQSSPLATSTVRLIIDRLLATNATTTCGIQSGVCHLLHRLVKFEHHSNSDNSRNNTVGRSLLLDTGQPFLDWSLHVLNSTSTCTAQNADKVALKCAIYRLWNQLAKHFSYFVESQVDTGRGLTVMLRLFRQAAYQLAKLYADIGSNLIGETAETVTLEMRLLDVICSFHQLHLTQLSRSVLSTQVDNQQEYWREVMGVCENQLQWPSTVDYTNDSYTCRSSMFCIDDPTSPHSAHRMHRQRYRVMLHILRLRLHYASIGGYETFRGGPSESSHVIQLWRDNWRVFSDSDPDICRFAWHLSQLLLLERLQAESSRTDDAAIVSLISSFIQDICHWDAGVILDYLIAEETINCRGLPTGGFLCLFMDWLKMLSGIKVETALSHESDDDDDDYDNDDSGTKRKELIIDILNQLRESMVRLIDRRLFPYPAGPLLRQLEATLEALQVVKIGTKAII